MDLSKLQLFHVAKTRMEWAGERQKVLAQNVANVDTPGYRARDLKALDFKNLARAQANRLPVAKTSAGHMEPSHKQVWREKTLDPPYETSVDGNSVDVEEQMLKVNQAKGQFNKAADLYRKHMGFLKLALGKNPR